MATYGGFTNGTYPAWALNLLQNVFGTAGIARGLQVTAPGGMTVGVSLNGPTSDGVCFIANGGFVRIDAALTFSVPNNGSGGTRTDAIVAFVDPTGAASPSTSITYQTNWAGGFGGASANQLVLALITVANGASSISSGNISMNSATAAIGSGGGGGGGNSMTDADGIGLKVQDNTSSSVLSVVLTGLTTGHGRAINIVATDRSAISHQFAFQTDGGLVIPGYLTMNGALSGITSLVTTSDVSVGGILNVGGYEVRLGMGNQVTNGNSGTSRAMSKASGNTLALNPNGDFSSVDIRGSVFTYSGSSVAFFVKTGSSTAGRRIFVGTSTPSGAQEGDIWIAA
jgi:hypothetical protein